MKAALSGLEQVWLVEKGGGAKVTPRALFFSFFSTAVYLYVGFIRVLWETG